MSYEYRLPSPWGDTSPDCVSRDAQMCGWFLKPVGAYVRCDARELTEAGARFVVGPVYEGILSRKPPGQKHSFVLDVSLTTVYDIRAQIQLVQWAVSRRAELDQVCIITNTGSSPMRQAVDRAVGVLRRIGIRITATQLPADAVLRHLKLAPERPPSF